MEIKIIEHVPGRNVGDMPERSVSRKLPAPEVTRAQEDSMTLKEYREFLIEGILEWAGDRFTLEELEKKATRSLERIYDNC